MARGSSADHPPWWCTSRTSRTPCAPAARRWSPCPCGSATSRRRRACSDPGLLEAHGQVEAVLRPDQLVVVVEAQVDLDPLHAAGEPPPLVVRGDRGAELVAHVTGLVGAEQERLGALDVALADRDAVDVQRHVAALADAATVVGELHAHLVLAGGDRLRGLDVVAVE